LIPGRRPFTPKGAVSLSVRRRNSLWLFSNPPFGFKSLPFHIPTLNNTKSLLYAGSFCFVCGEGGIDSGP